MGTWLCLERRGGRLKMAFSEDGKKWQQLDAMLDCELPGKLKVGVGVVALATTQGEFKVFFDNFKLTPLE
jgi:regulation of enolase protein 1 (concanavalin A-like superfamily)